MSILKNEIKRLQARVVEIEKEEEQERLNKCANDISWNFAKLKRLNNDVGERCAKIRKGKHEEYEEYTRNRYNKQYETFELWMEGTEDNHQRVLKQDLMNTNRQEWRSYFREWCISHPIGAEDGIPDCGPVAIKAKKRMEEALDAWYNTKNKRDAFYNDATRVHHVMERMDELVVSSHNLFGIMMARIETLENQLNGR